MNPWLIILIIIILLIVIYFIITFNSLTKLNHQCEEAFATMDVYLKKRWDLIPNIVGTVKGYTKHEKETLESLTKLRNLTYDNMSNEEKINANKKISDNLVRLIALSENYPELKSNTNFLSLQDSLTSVENDIAQSRKYFNATIRDYNNKVSLIPSNIVAKICGFKKKSMFEIDNKEKENVDIKF